MQTKKRVLSVLLAAIMVICTLVPAFVGVSAAAEDAGMYISVGDTNNFVKFENGCGFIVNGVKTGDVITLHIKYKDAAGEYLPVTNATTLEGYSRFAKVMVSGGNYAVDLENKELVVTKTVTEATDAIKSMITMVYERENGVNVDSTRASGRIKYKVTADGTPAPVYNLDCSTYIAGDKTKGTYTATYGPQYFEGESITVRGIAEPGYIYDTTVGAGAILSITENGPEFILESQAFPLKFTMPAKDVVVYVTKGSEPFVPGRVLYYASDINGTTAVESKTYKAGDSVTVYASDFTANPGYVTDIKNFTLSDTSIEVTYTDTTMSFTMPDTNITVYPSYAVARKVSPAPNANGTADFEKFYLAGTEVTLPASLFTPNEGYLVDTANFKVDGGNVEYTYTASSIKFTMPDRDITVEPAYGKASFVTAPAFPAERGTMTITPSNGLKIGDTVTIEFDYVYADTMIENIKVTCDGADVELKKNSGYKYTFTVDQLGKEYKLSYDVGDRYFTLGIKGGSSNITYECTPAKWKGGEEVTVKFNIDDSASNYKHDWSQSSLYGYSAKYVSFEVIDRNTIKFIAPADDLDFSARSATGYSVPSGSYYYKITGASNYRANEGDLITITATDGFVIPDGGVKVDFKKDSYGSYANKLAYDIQLKKVSDTVYTFVMPRGSVSINVKTEQLYKGDADSSVKNATVTFDKDGYITGDIAKIKVVPDAGYRIKDGKITVKQAQNEIYVRGYDGDYDITVPAGNFTVYAVIEKIPYNVKAYDPDNGTTTTNVATAGVGDKVIITSTPDAGYKMMADYPQVSAGGNMVTVTAESDGTYSFIMPARNVSIFTKFEKADYTVTASAAENGAVTVDKATAGIGDTVTVTVTPDEGYQLKADSLKVNGGAVAVTGADGTFTFTMPAENVTVTAEFEKVDYAVASAAIENGTIVFDKAIAQMGDAVVITVTPDEGYQLTADSLKVNDGAVEVTANEDGTFTFTMPAADVAVAVAFEKVDYALTAAENENGVIELDKETAQMDDEVNVTVTPAEGYKVVAVKVGDMELIANEDGTYTFVMGPADAEVTAEFAKIDYKVTAPEAENGKVALDKYTAQIGDTVTITATPDDGFKVAVVKVNGAELAANEDGTYSFVMTAADTEVVVEFAEIPAGETPDDGNGSGNGNTDVPAGDAAIGAVAAVALASAAAFVISRKKRDDK